MGLVEGKPMAYSKRLHLCMARKNFLNLAQLRKSLYFTIAWL